MIMHSRSHSHHIERSHATDFLLDTNKNDCTVKRQQLNQQIPKPEAISSIQSEQQSLSNTRIDPLSSPNPIVTMTNSTSNPISTANPT
jgi:hypothetical protein